MTPNLSRVLAALASLSLASGSSDHLQLLRQWEAEHGATPQPGARSRASVSSALNFSHVYTDSMILQRAPHPASIWGWAAPGAAVTVAIEKSGAANSVVASVVATASSGGQWRVSLPPQPASTAPVVISASTGASKISISDVLFGDVYVCSGQSNMAFSITVPTNDEAAEAKIAAAYENDPGASPNGKYITADAAVNMSSNYPNLRFLVVGNKHDCPTPIDDFFPSPGNNKKGLALAHPWQKSSPQSIGGGKDVMGGNGKGEMSATCWYFGMELHDTQKVPIGLIHSSYGGSAVEDWISEETLGDGKSGECPGPIVHSMGVPSQQWNGQLRPLLNTTIKGSIWYQGESNNGQDALYACRYQQLMTEWRKQWHIGTGGATDPEFPMGFVQIGPMTKKAPENTFSIRMGQTGDAGYAPSARWPNAFMSTAFDLANPPGTHCIAGCIHIFNKQTAAHRLALAARNMIYAEKLVFAGPRVESVSQSAGLLTVKYGAIGTEGEGIKLRGGYGFEVQAGSANATWVRVNATSATKDTVTLRLPSGYAGAKMLRYAFDDAPSVFTQTGPAVFNGEGLPANPGMYNVSSSSA